jgi:hypothetical protein
MIQGADEEREMKAEIGGMRRCRENERYRSRVLKGED